MTERERLNKLLEEEDKKYQEQRAKRLEKIASLESKLEQEIASFEERIEKNKAVIANKQKALEQSLQLSTDLDEKRKEKIVELAKLRGEEVTSDDMSGATTQEDTQNETVEEEY